MNRNIFAITLQITIGIIGLIFQDIIGGTSGFLTFWFFNISGLILNISYTKSDAFHAVRETGGKDET